MHQVLLPCLRARQPQHRRVLPQRRGLSVNCRQIINLLRSSRLSERQLKIDSVFLRQVLDQAQLRILSNIAHLSRTLRSFDVDIGEQAWQQHVMGRMALAHDHYIRPLQNNLHEHFTERYTLQTGEKRETQSVYHRSLESLKPISKNLVQRTRFCVMMDFTVPYDLQFDNVVSNVMVVTMPLSRPPEMAEIAVAMFAPELEGSFEEPPPKRFIFAYMTSPMACEGLLHDLLRILRKMSIREAARNEVAQVLH